MSEMTTVLIVDDEPIVRDVVVRYLQRDGFDTLEAGDGDAARSIIQSGAADLVVLDVMLPGTDGLALCRWIRTDSALPVIMLTARGEAADRIVGLELGADDYVTKPFSPRELAIRVRNVLKRAEAPPKTAAKTITFDELTIDGTAREVTLSGEPVRLTGKEFDLLFFLASQPARGVLPEAVDGSCLGVRSCARHRHGDGSHPPAALEDRARSVSPPASRDALGRRLQVRSVIHLAIVVALSTLAVGLLGAVALRRLSAVRAQLAAFGLLAVLLPLAAVLLSGWVMFHMGADVKILAVAAAAAASAVAVALVLAASITRPLEKLSASADRLAQGDLTVRAPTGGPRELARLGSSFNAMASELESLFDARRELIAAASHDLRTPVASITAMLEAIEDGLAQPEEYLAPLQEHARRLASLVDDLFELARIDAGALSHELQIVAVAPLVDSCVRGVEAVARARGVTLDQHLGEAPLVRCAPDQVERVLLNLLTNALQHTPSDGAIAVRLDAAEDHVTVSVEDTGSGLTAEAARRMFDRFWRSDPARSGGTGLGLAIARGLVEAQGGRIWAEGAATGGARVSFTLPVA